MLATEASGPTSSYNQIAEGSILSPAEYSYTHLHTMHFEMQYMRILNDDTEC